MVGIEELLQIMVQRGGSDLHITTGAPPKIRIDGSLISTEHEVLMSAGTKKIVYSVLTAEQIAKFEKDLELDISFGIEGVGRFRTNVFLQRGCVAGPLDSNERGGAGRHRRRTPHGPSYAGARYDANRGEP